MDIRSLWHLLAILLFPSLTADLKEELAFGKDWLYQDLLIQGETLWKGCGPDCPSRYEALKPLLDQFKRPFTVLDIGANNGYFSMRIASDYNALCVMIDGTDRLQKICELNSHLNNITYLKKFISHRDLEILAKTEHFDVILCFHVLHHVDWQPFFHALLKLADHVIIETPPINDLFIPEKPTIPAIANYLLNHPNAVQIGSFTRQRPDITDHMLLFSQNFSSSLIRRDFEHLEKYDPTKNEWLPIPLEISPKTYQSFGGCFPK